MIHVIPAKNRHFNDFGWLKAHWLFSFDSYHDPANLNFGTLRVFNDDVVDGHTGFPMHPHRDMEIITVVLDGEITHQDNMGNRQVIGKGDIQRMSAGTGVRHSEMNEGDRPVHLYQIWIMPDAPGIAPSYDYLPRVWEGMGEGVRIIASSADHEGAMRLNARGTISIGQLRDGQSHAHKLESSSRMFLYMTSGLIDLEGQVLSAGDQARIEGTDQLDIRAKTPAKFLMIELP